MAILGDTAVYGIEDGGEAGLGESNQNGVSDAVSATDDGHETEAGSEETSEPEDHDDIVQIRDDDEEATGGESTDDTEDEEEINVPDDQLIMVIPEPPKQKPENVAGKKGNGGPKKSDDVGLDLLQVEREMLKVQKEIAGYLSRMADAMDGGSKK